MKLTILEPRDQPASAVLDASGTLYVISDHGEVVTFTTLPIGDPLLPEYAQAHPEQFVGTATLPFLVATDANGVVFVGHADAVSGIVWNAPETTDGGTTATAGTTSGTSPTGTGATGTSAPEATQGAKAIGGGLYTSSGAIVVDGKHHHGKHHEKHAHHDHGHHDHPAKHSHTKSGKH